MDIFLIMRVVLYSNQCVAGVKWNCLAFDTCWWNAQVWGDVRGNILKSALGEREVSMRNLIGSVIAFLMEMGIYEEI